LEGAQVDVWHCDARGYYSDVQDGGFDTTGLKFLRGYQVTDETGTAKFLTIYPGWYSGRAVHIHFKIRMDPISDQGYEFTSQFFFDDKLTDVVHAEDPYAAKGQRNMRNEDDGIYQQSDGLLTLNVVPSETLIADDQASYTTTFDIGLDLSQTTQSQSQSQGGFGGTNGAGRPGGPGAPGGGMPPNGTPPSGTPGAPPSGGQKP
jgi:protocatechuate 3,4-dioxygenase beta subunit